MGGGPLMGSYARLVITTALTVSLVVLQASAQSAREWVNEADAHYRAGRFEESSRAYREAIAAGAVNPTTLHNCACAAALAGQVDLAFERLDDAIERGWRDVALTVSDGDLESLRQDPRRGSMIDAWKLADEEFQTSIELPEMRLSDRAVRGGESIPAIGGKTMGDVDTANTARMKVIVAKHGWPANRLVGEDGARFRGTEIRFVERYM